MDTKSIECRGKIFDGERNIPFTIYLFDIQHNVISGARVRIRSRTKTVEGFSDSKGVVILSPTIKTYGFFDIKNSESEELPKDCRVYSGFSTHKEDYLIIQKEGFHTIHIILGQLRFKSRFYNGEEVKAELYFYLLSSEI